MLILLFGELLSTMFSHSMSYFVTQNDCQTGFILSVRQKSFINHDFTARHTECIG
ncbi:Uncharacterised protein [Segatella copri]|nr:Uncharacterised protein [Segatella copri]